MGTKPAGTGEGAQAAGCLLPELGHADVPLAAVIMAFGIAGGGGINPPAQPARSPASSSNRPPACDQPPGQPHLPRLAPRRKAPATSCQAARDTHPSTRAASQPGL